MNTTNQNSVYEKLKKNQEALKKFREKEIIASNEELKQSYVNSQDYLTNQKEKYNFGRSSTTKAQEKDELQYIYKEIIPERIIETNKTIIPRKAYIEERNPFQSNLIANKMKNDLEGLQTIKIPSLNLRTNIDEINAFMANGTKKKKEILKMNLVDFQNLDKKPQDQIENEIKFGLIKNNENDKEDFEINDCLREKEQEKEEKLKLLQIKERKERKIQEKIEQLKKSRDQQNEMKNQKTIEFKVNLYKRDVSNLEEDCFNKYLSELFKSELLSSTLSEIFQPKIFKTHEKYSEQEKNALISHENFVLLGRSGTGKTFVAVTKMFLLKMCSNLKQIKAYLKNFVNKGKEEFYLRMIFTTTSPNLIEEVKKYYVLMEKKLMDSIKKEINIPKLELGEGKIYNTFDELKEKDYPLFIPVLQLVFLIESTIVIPIFLRDENAKIITNISNVNWYSEENRTFTVTKNFFFAINKQKYLTHCEINAMQEFIEVKMLDFSQFKKKFWEKKQNIFKKNPEFPKLNALTVWSEIMSFIKGSPESYSSHDWHLPKEQYLDYVGVHKTSISKEMKEKVWELSIIYEKWKTSKKYFDMMDIVAYLTNQILKGDFIFTNKPHTIYVDEVQDLSPAILFLLTLVAKEQIIFCGDTAQTIAKGVNFRFSDLKKIFSHGRSLNQLKDFSKKKFTKNIEFKILNINFRSQAKIIELGNVIINFLELLFPTSIDKVKKEKPVQKGMRPLLISDKLLLDKFLTKLNLEISSNENPTMEISHVILVRDNESKDIVEKAFSQFKCPVFTIFESKGLEFDDVILYNFFSDSNFKEDPWKILSFLEVNDEIMTEADFNFKFDISQKYDDTNEEIINENTDNVMIESGITNKNGRIHFKTLTKSLDLKRIDMTFHENLKNELKFLYTAITRTRIRLIIFDDKPQKRQPFEKILKSFDIIENLNAENFENLFSDNENMHFLKMVNINSKNSDISEIDRQNAYKWFRFKFYKQASVLFEKIKDTEMTEISKAFELVERAKENPLIAKKNYEDAAELFKKYKSFYLEAAKCLYSCEKYEEAKEKFIQTKSWVEAADTILKIIKTDPEKATLNKRIKDLYIEAVKYFDNAAKYAKALELCDICEEYQLMVILIIKYERYLNDFPNWFESKLRIYVVDIEKKILAIYKKNNEFFSSGVYEEFIKTFNKFEKSLSKIEIINQKLIRDLEKYDKKLILKELLSQNSISLPNPLAFFGLFQKFQNNEIGGLTFYNLKCYEVFIHFFYLSLLQNPKALIINKDNKTKSFIDDNFQICISMKNSFKKPISSYLKDKKYIKNLFLIEPRILLNIKMPKTELLNLIDMKIFFKKIDKLTNINQIMAFKKFPNVCKTLIKKSHNELISEFIKNIQNERNFYEFYKEFAKPIIFFANILTKINFGIKIKDFKDNDNLLKIIMNCFYDGYVDFIDTSYHNFGDFLLPFPKNSTMMKFIRKFYEEEDSSLLETKDMCFIGFDIIVLLFYKKLFKVCFNLIQNLDKIIQNLAINSIMPLKKIYSASKYLKILAENINDIYNERKEKFCCNTKKIIQDENQIKTNLNEKESELRNLYELCEDKCIEIDEKKKNLIFFLQNLRKIQKKEFLFVFRKEILFNSYLKILNFECKAREKMLFTLFSAKKHPSFEIKISFLNELNKIYFMKKFKPENVELKEINQIYQGEINIEKSEDYIPITNDIDETRSLMLKNAWKFRYHKCFFLKHLQFEINKIISQKSLLFIEPILNSTLMLTDKFDYAQTLDYNFQYVMPLFSEQNWQSIKNIQQNQYKNKYKIVKYFSSLMYILLCFLKNQAEKNENTGVHFLQKEIEKFIIKSILLFLSTGIFKNFTNDLSKFWTTFEIPTDFKEYIVNLFTDTHKKINSCSCFLIFWNQSDIFNFFYSIESDKNVLTAIMIEMINLLKNIFLVLEILSKAYFTTYERFLDKTYSIILKNFDIEFMGNYIYYHDNYHKSMDEIRRVYLEIYENYNHSPSEKNDYPPENNGNIIVSKLNKEFSIKEEVKENKNIKEVSLISHNDNLQSQEKINERLVNNLEATDKNSKLNDKNYEKIYNSDKDEKEKPKIIQEFDSSKIQDKKEVLKRDNGTAKTIIKMEKILCQMAPNNYSFNFLENFSIDCFYEDNNQKPSEFEQHSNIFEYMILFYFGKNKLNEEKIKAIEQKLKKISLEDFKKCLNINAKILENRKMILNNYFSKKIKKITDVYQTEKYLGENEKLLIELYEILEKEKPENIIKYLERFWYQLDQ